MLTAREYQADAARTSDIERDERERLISAGFGMASEVGEVVDLANKYLYHGHPLNRAAFAEELGDLAWYLVEFCNVVGLSFEGVLADNISKRRRLYPAGFDPRRSLYHEQGDD